MPYLGEIAGLSCGLVWAFAAFLWGRVGKGLTAFAINWFKAAVGFALMTVMVAVILGSFWPVTLTLRQQLILFGSGIIGLGIGDAFYFMALLKMGPRRSLLMWLAAPAMAAVLEMIYLKEYIGLIGWLGMVVTGIGIAVVQLEKSEKDERTEKPLTGKIILWGSIAGLIASLGQAISSLLTKIVLIEEVHPLQVVQIRLAAATVFLVAGGVIVGRMSGWIGQFKEKRVLWHGLFAVLLGTAGGLSLMTLSQKHIPIGLSNILTSTSPLFALPLAYFFFKSKITVRAVIGTVVALAGVVMVFIK